MSRDKQIEEISCIIYAGKTIGTPCVAIANVLYDQGYRKASDLAEEIFAEIDELLSPYGSYIKTIDIHEYIELKKKYIGEDTNVPTNTEN